VKIIGKPKIKVPPVGELIQIHTLEKTPEDFNSFLNKFSDNFINSKNGFNLGGQNLKPIKVKEKESEKDEKFKKKEKYEHGIKSEQSQEYAKKQAKFKYQISNMEFYSKVLFRENEEKLDVFFKYKIKGKGMMTKMIAKMLTKGGFGALIIQNTIDTLEDTISEMK